MDTITLSVRLETDEKKMIIVLWAYILFSMRLQYYSEAKQSDFRLKVT